MSIIKGTTLCVRDLFDVEKEFVIDVAWKTDGDNSGVQNIVLKKERKYIIPEYQREIRWKKEQVKALINDLYKKSEFIGNIILNAQGDNFEVIDGQQRLSVLSMIITFIQENITDKDSINTFKPCQIDIQSFKTYDEFIAACKEGIAPESDEMQEIIKPENDVYLQNGRYKEIWECIQDLLSGNDEKMESIFNWLYNCQMNILIFSNVASSKSAINYFLDVNQKGVKLDDEDIFKGYLFQYNAKEFGKRWITIKQQCCQINSKTECYPLLILFEQYFYACRNPLIDKNLNMPEFRKDFKLRSQWQDLPAGTHLIVALKNKTEMAKHLDNIIGLSKILKDISISSYPTNEFLEMFPKGIQHDTKQFIFYLCKAVLMSKNELPKIFLIKYLLDNFIEGDAEDKNKRNAIKVVYIYTLLFNLYSDISKKRENVYKYARQANWVDEVSKQIDNYFNKKAAPDEGFVLKNAFFAQYQAMEAEPDNTRREIYEFKAFACIYNYMQKQQGGLYTLGASREEDLYAFISDGAQYSLEHLLLNNGKNYTLYEEKDGKKYPRHLIKYIGGLFNFIYVPKCINSDVLGNQVMPAKVEILTGAGEAYEVLDDVRKEQLKNYPIKDAFSKMIIELLAAQKDGNKHFYFDGYWKAYYNRSDEEMTKYFNEQYTEDYCAFMNAVLEKFQDKFLDLKSNG